MKGAAGKLHALLAASCRLPPTTLAGLELREFGCRAWARRAWPCTLSSLGFVLVGVGSVMLAHQQGQQQQRQQEAEEQKEQKQQQQAGTTTL